MKNKKMTLVHIFITFSTCLSVIAIPRLSRLGVKLLPDESGAHPTESPIPKGVVTSPGWIHLGVECLPEQWGTECFESPIPTELLPDESGAHGVVASRERTRLGVQGLPEQSGTECAESPIPTELLPDESGAHPDESGAHSVESLIPTGVVASRERTRLGVELLPEQSGTECVESPIPTGDVTIPRRSPSGVLPGFELATEISRSAQDIPKSVKEGPSGGLRRDFHPQRAQGSSHASTKRLVGSASAEEKKSTSTLRASATPFMPNRNFIPPIQDSQQYHYQTGNIESLHNSPQRRFVPQSQALHHQALHRQATQPQVPHPQVPHPHRPSSQAL